MAEEPQLPSSIGLGAEAGEHDDGLSAFAGVRPRLFGIAYRMLGSASEAEDVVHESASILRNPPRSATKPTSGPGFPNRWILAAIPD